MNILPEKSNGLTPQHPVYPHVESERHPKRQLLYMGRAAHIFAKYYKKMLVIFAAVFSLVVLITFLWPPTYSSKATMILERNVDTEKSILLGVDSDQLRDLKDWLLPEIEILKSGVVMERVVRNLNLHNPDNEKLTEQDEAELIAKKTNALKEAVLVENPRRSNVINLKYENSDPQLAAKVVNEVVKNYRGYRNEIYSESNSFTFFTNQLSKVEAELKTLDDSLTRFKKKNGVVSPDAQIQMILHKLGEYQKTLTEARTDRIGRSAKLAIIRENIKGDKLTSIPVLENTANPSRYTYWSRIRLELLAMEMRRDSLIQNYTDEYQGVKHLDAQIAETKQKMFREVQQILVEEETQIRALRAEENELQAAIRDIRAEIENFSEKEVDFVELTRGIESKKEVVAMLVRQKDEARITQAKDLHGIAVRVVNAAGVPISPIKPMKKMNLVVGFLFALLLALGIVLVLEFFDNTIDTPEKVERYIELPVLATISDCEVSSK